MSPSYQRLLTRDEFSRYVVDDRIAPQTLMGVSLRQGRVLVRPPYDVVPCRCGDINCHGWKVVEHDWSGSGVAAGTTSAPGVEATARSLQR